MEFWLERAETDDIEIIQRDPLDCDLKTDSAEQIRYDCIGCLSLLLEPLAGEDVGAPQDWMDMLDEHLELLR